MNQPRIPVERIITGLLLGLGFLVMASIFVPGPTHADLDRSIDPTDAGSPAQMRPAEKARTENPLSLGSIESGEYRVEMFAGPEGPRFSVFYRDAPSPLADQLDHEQVQRLVPGINLEEMLSEPQASAAPPQRTADHH